MAEQDPVFGDPDWMRPRSSEVPVEPARWDGGKQETVSGDPIDIQDWDYRLWERT